MSVFQNLKSLAGTQYHHLNHSSDIMDISFLRQASEEGFRLPSAQSIEREEGSLTSHSREKYWGAYVETPTAGVHHNVAYYDLASLYPNTFASLNVSPETLLGTKEQMKSTQFEVHEINGEEWVSPINVRKREFLSWDWTASTVEESTISEDECVNGYIDTRDVKWVDGDSGEDWHDYTDPSKYKTVCDSSSQTKKKWEAPEPQFSKCYYIHPQYKKGFMSATIEEWIEEKYRYTGELYDAIKAIVNSSYGYTGTPNSRLFDWRIAETITLSGQKIWKYTAKEATERLSERTGDDVFVAVGDTDGMGLTWENGDYGTFMAHLSEITEYINGDGYDSFMKEEFGVDDHSMEVEVESYAQSLFVPAVNPQSNDDLGVKKRYAQLFSHDEADEGGDKYGLIEDDSLSITGLEAKRSDVSPLTTEAQKHVLEQLLRGPHDGSRQTSLEASDELRNGVEGSWDEVSSYLRQKREEVLEGDVDVEYVAKRSGIGKDIESYGTANRKPSTAYRGAKFADREVAGESISEGSKVSIVYVKEGQTGPLLPSTFDSETAEDGDPVDVIAVEEMSNLPNGVSVDWTKHYQKSLKEPLSPIIRTVGWTWSEIKSGQRQQSLTGFRD